MYHSIIIISVAVLLLCSGCMGFPVYQLSYLQDEKQLSGFTLQDFRIGTSTYYKESNCETHASNQIQLGDENFEPGRIKYLERTLADKIPVSLNGKIIELVNFDTYIMQSDGCGSNLIPISEVPITYQLLSQTIHKPNVRGEKTDRVITTIAVIIDNQKYSAKSINNAIGPLGDSIYDLAGLEVSIVDTIEDAVNKLVKSIQNGHSG